MTERYTPGRGGIQLSGKGSKLTYGIGYFEADGDGSDDFHNTAVTARGTFAPFKRIICCSSWRGLYHA